MRKPFSPVACAVARAVACTATLLAGCDGNAPPAPPAPGLPASVTSVDTLRPGEIARVRGSALTSLRSIKLDGVSATELIARSDSVAEFRVPTIRACDTDKRVVKVSVDDAAPIEGVVRVAPNMSLRPAESRVLTMEDLQCLRLAGADEDYVLSAANLAMPTTEIESLRALVAVRVLGTGDAAAAAISAAAISATDLAPMTDQPTEIALPTSGALSGSYAQAPTPFDPRYATAVAGDTLRFVDWFAPTAGICQLPAESVPSYQARVLAVSGKVAVVVDLRHPMAGAFFDASKLGWLRDAVALTDRLLLPTMRSLFAADYAPPAGGGGRFYLKVGSMPASFGPFAGFAYDGPLPTINIASQASCPRSSEMVVSTISAEWLASPQNQNVSAVSGLFLHEYAHSADALTSGRGRIAGIIGEGLATLAEETASRIASTQPMDARHALVGADAPAITGGALGMWGTQPQLGPWQGNGRYGTNARMLMFLRELVGEASIDHRRQPTLYQRLLATPIDWASRAPVIAHITTTLGIDYAELTDRQTLASVTAGLIAPDVMHSLPRYTTWNHAERARVSGPLAPGFPSRVGRRVDGEYTLAAADGGHAALYLMADGTRGVSLQVLSMASSARTVRLTRLR